MSLKGKLAEAEADKAHLLGILGAIRAAVYGEGCGPIHGQFPAEIARLAQFRRRVAGLLIRGELDDDGAPFDPSDPEDDRETLEALIREARRLPGAPE